MQCRLEAGNVSGIQIMDSNYQVIILASDPLYRSHYASIFNHTGWNHGPTMIIEAKIPVSLLSLLTVASTIVHFAGCNNFPALLWRLLNDILEAVKTTNRNRSWFRSLKEIYSLYWNSQNRLIWFDLSDNYWIVTEWFVYVKRTKRRLCRRSKR